MGKVIRQVRPERERSSDSDAKQRDQAQAGSLIGTIGFQSILNAGRQCGLHKAENVELVDACEGPLHALLSRMKPPSSQEQTRCKRVARVMLRGCLRIPFVFSSYFLRILLVFSSCFLVVPSAIPGRLHRATTSF